MAMVAFVGATLAYKPVRPVAVLILPISAVLMVVGGILPCHPLGPSPVFKGWQLWGHVIGGGFSFGFALLAAGMGLFYLLKAKGKTGYPYDQLPDLEILERLNYRFVVTSFILAMIMVHFAVLWAHMNLPADFMKRAGSSIMILVWAYLLIYMVWLAMRWGLRWRGRKLALYSTVAVILVMVCTFYVAPFREKSYHTGPFFPPYDAPEEMKPFLKKNMKSSVKPDKLIDDSVPVEVDKEEVEKVAKLVGE
jgi:ABC-type uncharacterized transport system permease subunit